MSKCRMLSEEERLACPALVVEGLTTSFSHGSKKFTLEPISFELERGFILGLIGQNGAGKSTFLRLLTQQVARKKGHFSVAGIDVRENPLMAQRTIGYVGEDLHLLPRNTVMENGTAFGAFFKDYSEERYRDYLKRFEIGENMLCGKLSKGETTRVQLAFALSHSPELLVLDEPTSGMDPLFRQEFLTMLQEELMKERTSVIFSTHITEDLDKIADYILLLEKGKVGFLLSKEELWEQLREENGEVLTIQKMMYQRAKEADHEGNH